MFLVTVLMMHQFLTVEHELFVVVIVYKSNDFDLNLWLNVFQPILLRGYFDAELRCKEKNYVNTKSADIDIWMLAVIAEEEKPPSWRILKPVQQETHLKQKLTIKSIEIKQITLSFVT